MKLLSLNVYKHGDQDKSLELAGHFELSSFGFFHRNAIKEHIRFHSRLLASRTQPGGRQTVEFEQNIGRCYVYVHPCGLAATCVADTEYPMRVAFQLLSLMIAKFDEKHKDKWPSLSAETALDFPEGEEALQKFQDPSEADKITKIEKELDEVKGIVIKSMDDILKRGETLDSLMQKSSDLSNTSYQFYRQAKKNNQCCKMY